MPRNEKLPRRPKLNPREEQALRLRTLGLTYREIARQLNVHVSTAYDRVMRGLRALRHLQHEAPGDVRHIELLKLAQLERRVMSEAVTGDHGAIRLLLRIMDSRKRYLAACLPTTSSKEELDELLRMFTQPLDDDVAGEVSVGEHPGEHEEAPRDQEDRCYEEDERPVDDEVESVEGANDEPFPAVADLAPSSQPC